MKTPSKTKPGFAQRISTKRLSLIFALATLVWLPLSLFINPGWGTLVLMSPYALLCLLPLLLPILNRRYKSSELPRAVFVMQVGFYVSLALLACLYVNGGDTESSVGSIFSRLFRGFADYHLLLTLSSYLLVVAFWVVCALLLLNLYLVASVSDKSQRVAKVQLFVLIILIISAVIVPIARIDLDLRQRFGGFNTEMERFRHEIMSPVGAIEIGDRAEGEGDGLMSGLQCYPSVECPKVERSWLMPLSPGQESLEVSKSFERMGYKINPDTGRVYPCDVDIMPNGCSLWARGSDGREIWVYYGKATGIDVPSKNVSPKVWRLVKVIIRH